MTVTITSSGCYSAPLVIGRRGENEVKEVNFDYSDWISEYGDGAITLLVKRKGDTSAYPVALTTADGIATWTVSDTDTSVNGYGKCEWVYTVGTKVAKSVVLSIYVDNDIGDASDTPPDPYESWIDTLTQLGAETLQNATDAAQSATDAVQSATDAAQSATDAAASATAAQEAADSITGMTVETETLEPGSAATASWDGDTLTLGIPQGEKGEKGDTGATGAKGDKGDTGATGADGYSPTATVTQQDGVTTISITDKDGTTTAEINIDATLSISGDAADAKATGEAIDDVKSAFENIGYTEQVSANLLNPSELEAGRITSTSSAVLHTGSYDTDYKTTGFMHIDGGEKYAFYVKTTLGNIVNCAVANIWAYDELKAGLSYLGNISYNASGTTYITAPANAKYIRASLVTGTFTNFAFVQFSETEGTAPSELVQYQKDIYLNGYVRTAELEATNTEVNEIKTVIDDNFTDVYEPITGGTTTNNKYINASGVVDDISSAYNTTTISASAGDKFKVTAKAYLNAYYYGFFDSTDTLIEGLKSTQSGTTEINDVAIVAPANTAYLVAVGYATYATIKGVTGQVVNSAVPWTGKKWVCIGDSLTERNVTTTKNYYDYISEASGITPYIMGVGGTGYVRGYDVTKAFYQRISDVPTDADFVTIFGSGNDLNIEAMAKFNGKTWSEALGTYTDTGTDTICGCVNTCLDNYFAAMVTAPIGIIAPSPWRPYPTTTPNNRMSDYVSALMQIAEYRGVPFLDLYHCSNLRPENAANRAACYYDGDLDGNGDGVHPNALGHQIIASKIYEFVKTMLLN